MFDQLETAAFTLPKLGGENAAATEIPLSIHALRLLSRQTTPFYPTKIPPHSPFPISQLRQSSPDHAVDQAAPEHYISGVHSVPYTTGNCRRNTAASPALSIRRAEIAIIAS
jgi:hypothetical protein